MPHRVTAGILHWMETCGRIFVAIAMVGFGVQHILYQGFFSGLELLPERLPGHTIWAYFTGAVFIAAGVAIGINRRARLASMLIANLFFFSILVRRVPGIAAIVRDLSERTVVFEALAIGGGCLILAAALPDSDSPSQGWISAQENVALAGRIFFAVSMSIFGWSHLLVPKFIATLIPNWIPAHLFLAYFTAFAFIAAAVSIATRVIVRPASSLLGVMFLFWVAALHAPRVAAALQNKEEWNSLFVCLAMSGFALVLPAYNPAREASTVLAEPVAVKALTLQLVRSSAAHVSTAHAFNGHVRPAITDESRPVDVRQNGTQKGRSA
jgi:uncharacterized membrane protein YphA (DoxX/SURF4 family)